MASQDAVNALASLNTDPAKEESMPDPILSDPILEVRVAEDATPGNFLPALAELARSVSARQAVFRQHAGTEAGFPEGLLTERELLAFARDAGRRSLEQHGWPGDCERYRLTRRGLVQLK